MRIRVVRESGGLGDIVRCIPALAGLRRRWPEADIEFFCPSQYHDLIERADDPWPKEIVRVATPCHDGARRARLAPLDEKRWPYLATGRTYDLDIDLYCPGFAHEARNGGNVWHDRIELFCAAAGVPPSTPVLPLTDDERAAARDRLAALAPRQRGYILLQPYCTDPGRDWPPSHWRALAERLRADGFSPIMLDWVVGRSRTLGFPVIGGLPHLALAAVLAQARLVIGPDSGLCHLAGAVGARAIGLTASQSGGTLYRHYPTHLWCSPDVPCSAGTCALGGCDRQWPCYWRRGPHCVIREMRQQGRTCPLLARLSPDDVFWAATQAVMAPPPRTLPPPVAHVPLSRADGIQVDLDADLRPFVVEARDFTYASAQMCAWHADAADRLWEAARVLKVGGKLRVHLNAADLGRRLGFATLAATGEVVIMERATTWPRIQRPPQWWEGSETYLRSLSDATPPRPA